MEQSIFPTDNPIELERRCKEMGLSRDNHRCGVARSEPRHSRTSPSWKSVLGGKFGNHKFHPEILSS